MERGIWKPNGEVSPACPRCGSPNTKFCYYNNYSLTQPRYFCKGCRRYWTKGGSLRNVPVGGGCRKSRRGKSVRTAPVAASRTSRHESNIQAENYDPASGSSSVIDLAAVYANFLNQTPQPDDHPYKIEAPIEFSGFQTGSDLPDLPQDINGFLQSGPLFGPRIGFLGGPDVVPKQHFPTENGFTSMNMINDDDMLPTLPGEEGHHVVLSEGMVWPNSDVVLQNQLQGDEHNQLPGDEHNSVNGNINIFGGLNLEAIFRF